MSKRLDGHSMGGQAATRACLEYVVFKACACLDGLNPFFYLRPKPSRKPFLLLINSTWGTSIVSQSLAQRYLAAWVAPEVFVIRGTKHNSFDALPLLDHPEQRAKAPSDPIKAHAVIAAIVVEFFDRSFGYGKATRLNSDILQNVIVVDLRQIAGNPQHARRLAGFYLWQGRCAKNLDALHSRCEPASSLCSKISTIVIPFNTFSIVRSTVVSGREFNLRGLGTEFPLARITSSKEILSGSSPKV